MPARQGVSLSRSECDGGDFSRAGSLRMRSRSRSPSSSGSPAPDPSASCSLFVSLFTYKSYGTRTHLMRVRNMPAHGCVYIIREGLCSCVRARRVCPSRTDPSTLMVESVSYLPNRRWISTAGRVRGYQGCADIKVLAGRNSPGELFTARQRVQAAGPVGVGS